MATPDEDWLDPDISAMNLDYGEKSGLQIYRNYTVCFEKYAIKRFVENLDLEEIDLSAYRRLVALIISEEARFLPVIICAFADDILKETFKAALPDDVPGGKTKLLSGYGPLSDFSKRIHMAYAFDVLSPELMKDLDRLRAVRNKISHNLNFDSLEEFIVKNPLTDMTPIGKMLPEREDLAVEFAAEFTPLAAFRIRLIWISGRLIYESAAYTRAKKENLQPNHALYGQPCSRWPREIASIALDASRNSMRQ